MKRFTLLFVVMALFAVSALAQFLPPTTDVFLKHTQAGTISEIAPYNTGFVYISNDGTNDVISYTTDGITFTDAESLETGTAKGLMGWDDSNVAFYLGNNTTDAVGVELRKIDNGTPGYILDHNPISDPNQGLLTSVERYYNGSSYEYHYLYQTGVDMFLAPQVSPYVTDGTELNTFELTASDFGAQGVNSMTSKMFSASFNGSLYYAAQKTGWMGAGPTIYQVNGGSLTAQYTSSDALASLYGLISTSQNLYFLSGNYGDFSDPTLLAMDASHSASEVLDGNNNTVMVDDAIEMKVLNDNMYVVSKVNGLSKLAEVNGTSVKYFHLNAEDASDNIVDMVVSGGYVYVLASETGGNTELYALNPTRSDARFVKASGLDGNYGVEQKLLTAINGGVAFVSVTGGSDAIFISDGNDGNTKSLMVEGNPTLAITQMQVADDNLYVFSNNGTDTEIYEYAIAAFPSKAVTATVVETGVGTAIEGATVTFDNGLTTFSGTTDATGAVEVTGLPYGYLDAIVTVSGYAELMEAYYVGDFSMNPTFELTPAKSFAFVVYDETQRDPLFGGGELEGAQVELTDGTNTYNATSDMSGFADFTDVVYGTYNYTVIMPGYVTATSSFTVDATTNGGPLVGLNPVSTSIDDVNNRGVSIYPNPFTSGIKVSGDAAIVSLEIYNASGALSYSLQGSEITYVDLSTLPAGVYIVLVKDVNGNSVHSKVTKK